MRGPTEWGIFCCFNPLFRGIHGGTAERRTAHCYNWGGSGQFLVDHPETDIMDQFLDPETDIMGERTYIDLFYM